jgi:hypothetical protein
MDVEKKRTEAFDKESVVDKRLENGIQKVQGCVDKKVVWIKVNNKEWKKDQWLKKEKKVTC